MPAITIQSIELAESQKKVIAKEFVRIFSELTNVPQDRVYIFFDGYQLNEVGTAGILFSEKPPQRAKGKFNEAEWEMNAK